MFLHIAKPVLSNKLILNIRKAGMSKDRDRQAISALVFAKNLTRFQSVTAHSAETEVTTEGVYVTVTDGRGDGGQ